MQYQMCIKVFMSLVPLLVYCMVYQKYISPNFPTNFSSGPFFQLIIPLVTNYIAKYLVPLLSELNTNQFTEDNSYSFVKNL